MMTVNSCPVCDSRFWVQSHALGATYDTTVTLNGIELPARLVATYRVCQKCGTIFQSPRLDDDALNLFYSNGTYRQIVGFDGDEDEKRRAEYIAQLVDKTIGSVNKHLDVGCSRGYLLKQVGAMWKEGVEPNMSYVDKEGINEVHDDISEVTKQFDLITAVHVLEHVSSPVAFLSKMVNRLAQNGNIVIEVPSEMSPGGWPRLPHLYHFPAWALHTLADRAALQITHIAYTPHLFAVMRRKYD